MTREQLLQPGQYFGLPKALARDSMISTAAKLVWGVVADRLGSHETAWPAYPRIAADAGISPSTAKRAIKELEQRGWVAVQHRPGESNIYTLSMPNPGQLSTRAKMDPVQVGAGTGAKLAPPPDQTGTTTPANLTPELLNRTTELTTKEKTETAALRCAGAGAVAPGASDPQPLEAGGRRRSKSKRKADGDRLTPLQVERICKSLDSMTRYLLYGLYGLDQDGELPPSSMNWRKYQNPSEQDFPKRYGLTQWKVPTFAAYFWWRVSQWRTDRNHSLTLPQWGRLIGDIKNLQKTMTPRILFLYICTVVQYFDLIKFMKGTAGASLRLDFDSLNNGMIRTTALEIMEMGQEKVDVWVAKMMQSQAA